MIKAFREGSTVQPSTFTTLPHCKCTINNLIINCMNGKEFKRAVIEDSLDDIKVELDEEFDRNFSRKGFFTDNGWEARQFDDGRGSLMSRSGGLRRSIHSRKKGGELVYTSSKPYARIHNEGGEIKVTAKMKRYFWAKYYESYGKVLYSVKTKQLKGNKRNLQLNERAEFYQRMAMKRVGSTITMPERRFIGSSKETDTIIRRVTQENITTFFEKHNPFEKK